MKSPEGAPAPGELFSAEDFFEGPRRRLSRPQPTAALDAYTLSLEIELVDRDRQSDERQTTLGRVPASPSRNDNRSTRVLVGDASRALLNHVTSSRYRQECTNAMRRPHREWRLRAKVGLLRRRALTVRKLFQGGMMDCL